MYLIRYKQILKEIVLPSRKQCDTLQLGYPGILAKISKDRKTWSYAAGVADLRTKNNESRLSLSYWQCYEDIHCNSATSIGWREPLEFR